MEFTLQTHPSANIVRSWSPGEIRVGPHVIQRSVILHPSEIVFDWPPRSAGAVTPQDLEPVLALEPEIILLGTGKELRFPDPQIAASVLRRGVGFEVMDSGAACRTYNILVYEDRPVAAAIVIEVQ